MLLSHPCGKWMVAVLANSALCPSWAFGPPLASPVTDFPAAWAGHPQGLRCQPRNLPKPPPWSGLWTPFTSGRPNVPLPQMNGMTPQESQRTKAVVGSETYPGPVRASAGMQGAVNSGKSEYSRLARLPPPRRVDPLEERQSVAGKDVAIVAPAGRSVGSGTGPAPWPSHIH